MSSNESSQTSTLVSEVQIEYKEEDLLDLNSTRDITEEWDMVEDTDIPKAGDESSEDCWESVRLVSVMFQSKLDGEEYVADEFISSNTKTKLLGQLKEVFSLAMDSKLHYEKEGDSQKVKKYEERVEWLVEAIDVVEASIQG